jgi:hypothetical protein
MEKKQIGTLVIAIVLTVIITYFLIPSKTTVAPHSMTQADTGKAANSEVAAAIKQRDEVLKENGWLKNLLKLAQVQKPTGGAVSKPTTSPIAEIIPTPKDSLKDSSKVIVDVPPLNPYDFPVSMSVTKNKITFLTLNPYLKYCNLPYVKTYEFDRTTSDFEFALTQTDDYLNLNGIVFKSKERFFSFDGITAGAGAMFPKDFYALLEIKFSMYERLHINPRVTSRPEAGIELKYDIIK